LNGGGVQHVFAPWRFAYVSHAETGPGCIFCAAATGGADELTVLQGRDAFVLLNRYPYTSGHAMVAPRAHVAELADLDGAVLAEMMRLAQRVVEALREIYRPHGFNLGLNLGEAAGAGIADHLHLHIVPRWRGDTSFMTVSGGVRVIPEDLGDTYRKLVSILETQRASQEC
jgi:ATP adenylyltransferase